MFKSRSKISLMMVVVMFVTLLSSTMSMAASELDIKKVIQKEIQKEIEIARQEIYIQLKRQNALILMETYEELIYPQIENQIWGEYTGITPMANYSAPNGGFVTYLTPVSGYNPTELAITCLTRDDSYQYFLDRESFTMSHLLSALFGYVPDYGDVSGTILTVQGLNDALAKKSVNNAGGCAKIINTRSGIDGTRASLITGWSDRYNIYVPSNAYSLHITRF